MMPRWMTNLAVKTAALVLALCALLAAVGLAGAGGLALVLAEDAGTTAAARARTAEIVLYRYGREVGDAYLADCLEDYAEAPFTYEIYSYDGGASAGEMLASTAVGGPCLATATYYYWYAEWTDANETVEKRLDIVLYATDPLTGEGWLPLLVNTVGWWHTHCRALLVLAVICFLLFCFLTVYLHRAAGWHPDETAPRCNAFDRVPFDAFTALFLGAAVAQGMLLGATKGSPVAAVILAAVCALLDVLLLLWYTMSIATRVKTHTLWRNTLIWRILRLMGRGLSAVGRRLPLLWQAMAGILAVLLVELLVLANGEVDTVAAFWVMKNLLLVPLLLLVALGLIRLQEGIRRIAGGQVDHQVDTRYLPGALRRAAQDINHIGDGLSEAVEARLRSERFKTELITNVSHDIKTPLTSIVNYVDLLQKEQPESERMREYLRVLERQSGRLKKLIEDLVEASKASTGSLPVHPALCELTVLLEQTVGEYAEKAAAAGLTVLVTAPRPVTVLADGKHLWRVFDNLLNNACKYAQPGTRVYLDLEADDGIARVTFRNISRAPLNLSGEALLERFVRGDGSRSTEGSGLGLSIARSLTELQGGTLDITVDGDLFKVVLCLPSVGDAE